MPGVLDILPPSDKVAINAKESIDVYGISIKGIAVLLSRFPYLLGLMSGQKDANGNTFKIGADAIAAIGAAAIRMPGDEAAEEWVSNLPVDVQLEIIEKVGRRTFPDGFGPFVERLKVLSGQASDQVNAATKDGKESDTISPSQPQPSKRTKTRKSST